MQTSASLDDATRTLRSFRLAFTVQAHSFLSFGTIDADYWVTSLSFALERFPLILRSEPLRASALLSARMDIQLRNDFQVDLSSGEEHRSLIAWLVFHVVGGQVLLPILCATFLFTRVQRHPVMINMCLTWVLTSIIACLLLYSNQYQSDQPVLASPDPLCLVQAVLYQHAVPPMIAVSAFALIYHVRHQGILSLLSSMLTHRSRQVWSTVRTTISKELPRSLAWLRSARVALLLSAPYFAFAVFAIIGAVVSTVSRTHACATTAY